MTTQKIEVAHEPLVKQKFNWLLAIGIFIVGLALGAFVTTLPSAKTESGEENAVGPIVRDFPARPDLAESAAPTYSRGPTLAEYTAAIEENKANVQRGIEAETARYNGLVKFYGAKDGANSLTWPPRPTQFPTAENAGVSRDENALAAYHQSERDFTPIVTSRIEENALDAYHQSEWGLTPSAVLPSEEDALDAYHQSEWGRTLSTVLPIARNETDADQDLGVMDFSPVGNEAGMQRHDREYGLAGFSHISEIDADQDIGLMEFFTAPNETSRQRTEPGTLEALPNIDPADRKFFSPDYGAMSGVSKEAEVLPTFDPADRKFFSPGYGAQTTSAKRSEAVLPLIENKMGQWSAIWFLLK